MHSDDPSIQIDDDALFWWRSIGPFLNTLLTRFHYGDEQRRAALTFSRDYIAPSLGPRPGRNGDPRSWKSFMTDDFTPIEFSWAWGKGVQVGQASRRVRFSVEPISPLAGSPTDPWNVSATFSLLRKLAPNLKKLDLGSCNELFNLLVPSNEVPPKQTPSSEKASLSSIFLAFELGDDEPMVKAYLMAAAKAAVTGQSEGLIIKDALTQYATKHKWQDLMDLVGTLCNKESALQLHPFIVAVDCVAPQDSRIKVYVRSPDTSFSAVRQVLSIFDDPAEISEGLKKLRELWQLLFGLDDFSPLPRKEHQTAGMLYYLEVRPQSKKTTIKVYLPIKHYAKDDYEAAIGLTTFMKTQNCGRQCDDYLLALKEACQHRALESSLGIQTYISCAVKGDTLDLTSYLNPEIYGRKGNW